jgi:hypothetical protein
MKMDFPSFNEIHPTLTLLARHVYVHVRQRCLRTSGQKCDRDVKRWIPGSVHFYRRIDRP